MTGQGSWVQVPHRSLFKRGSNPFVSRVGAFSLFSDVSILSLYVYTLHNYSKKANVPGISFHNLRHTHATIFMRIGENPKVVSERLGHARVGITLDIYSHTNEEMQKKTADRFDDRFWT